VALNASVTLHARAVSFGHVHRYELREALHQLLDLRVEIRTEDPALDVAALVGARARVRFDDEPVHKEVVGIVRTIQQLSAEPTGLSRYELWVVPPCWLTTRRTDQRIFQHRTVPEIVADVLAGYGERLAAPDAQLAEEHPAREYCVQYGETDWDFVLRILSEEGITAMFLPDDAAGAFRAARRRRRYPHKAACLGCSGHGRDRDLGGHAARLRLREADAGAAALTATVGASVCPGA
jgi:type VI secretion system secreted protein VgrG